MKALLLTEVQTLEVVDNFPEPDVGPHDVLVEVAACGICGSDIHGYDGSSGRRIPPLVMGHEASGTVVQIGSAVTTFAAGHRVAMDSMVSCGGCAFCKRGETNLCDNRRVLGVSCGEYRKHGAFAKYVAVPAASCYALPDELSFEHAAMIEPTSIAVHAVGRLPVELGDVAVVVGSGMIGMLALQCLRLAGCSKVVVIDLDDSRLAMAKSLGADVTLNSKNENVVEAIGKLTSGRGADLVVEAVGIAPTVKLSIDLVRKGGSVALVGNLQPDVPMPLQSVVTREVTLYGMCASLGSEYPRCIELLASGKIVVDPLITARAPLESGPDWFRRLYAGESGAMKVILQPGS